MSNTNANHKRQEWTPHGPIEYETALCANCDEEIVSESVIEVGVGVRRKRCSFSTCSGGGFTVEGTAPLCPYCAEHVLGYTGPATGATAVKRLAGEFMSEFLNAPLGAQFMTLMAILGFGLVAVMMVAIPIASVFG